MTRAADAAAAALSRRFSAAWHSAWRSRQYASSRGPVGRLPQPDRLRPVRGGGRAAHAGQLVPGRPVVGGVVEVVVALRGEPRPARRPAARAAPSSAASRRPGTGPRRSASLRSADHQRARCGSACPACRPAGAAPRRRSGSSRRGRPPAPAARRSRRRPRRRPAGSSASRSGAAAARLARAPSGLPIRSCSSARSRCRCRPCPWTDPAVEQAGEHRLAALVVPAPGEHVRGVAGQGRAHGELEAVLGQERAAPRDAAAHASAGMPEYLVGDHQVGVAAAQHGAVVDVAGQARPPRAAGRGRPASPRMTPAVPRVVSASARTSVVPCSRAAVTDRSAKPDRLVELGHDEGGPRLGAPDLRVAGGHLRLERRGRLGVGGPAPGRQARLPEEAAQPLQGAGALGALRPGPAAAPPRAGPRPRPGRRRAGPSRPPPARGRAGRVVRAVPAEPQRPLVVPPRLGVRVEPPGLAGGPQAPVRRLGRLARRPPSARSPPTAVTRSSPAVAGQRPGGPLVQARAARWAAAGRAPPRTSGRAGTCSRRPRRRARRRRRPRGRRPRSGRRAAPTRRAAASSAHPEPEDGGQPDQLGGVGAERVDAGQQHVLHPPGAGVLDQLTEQVGIALRPLVPGVDVDVGRTGERGDELAALLRVEPLQLDVRGARAAGPGRRRPAAPARPRGASSLRMVMTRLRRRRAAVEAR